MNKKQFTAVVSILVVLAFALPTTSLAAPPPNDNFADAIVIEALPFSDTRNTSEATTEPGEPQPCFFSPHTFWYSFTPAADGAVRADTAGSSFSDTTLNVYQAIGPGINGLSFLGCASFGASISFSVQAGTTYYIQAGNIFESDGDLRVNLAEVPPPPNDDFSNATPFTDLPFSDSVDTAGASLQAGEPTPSCVSPGDLTGTVWYAFTPAASGSVSARIDAPFSTAVAAYTGDSLDSLAEVGCRSFWGILTFRADAGTTYYFQVGNLFGTGGSLTFNLDVTPAPEASFFFDPGDPSLFDTIQFFDSSFDPGEVGIESQAWEFGDGATATGCCPTHQYASDGDYTVQLTVTTFDGRTASTSQLVHVETHDVAITRFAAPQAAHSGQTRRISVDVNSKRRSENVEVQLFKSVPGGFQFFGSLTQFVPVRPSNRTTQFNFSYTFTSDDASIGKVTFKAVAIIHEARDALPADNEAIASPTRVRR